MRLWSIALAGALALAGLFYWLLGRQQAREVAGQQLQAPLLTTVAVAPVQRQLLAPTTEYVGQTQAAREVQLLAPAAGLVRAVPARLNSQVAAGQALVCLDPAGLRQQLGTAQQAAQQASRDEQRQRQLLAESNTTPHEVENAALQTHNAATQATTLATQLRDATVRAPFAGTISERPVEPGLYVQPGALLLTLTDVRTVKLVVQVPEAELRGWRVGRTLPVRFEAYPGTVFSGQVHHLGLKGGEGGRFPVEIQVVNNKPASPLRVGLTARVSLPAAVTDALTVPRVALAPAAGGPQAAVYVLQRQRVRRRSVQVGASYGSRVAVRGVQANEQVVISGTQALRDGLAVRVASAL